MSNKCFTTKWTKLMTFYMCSKCNRPFWSEITEITSSNFAIFKALCFSTSSSRIGWIDNRIFIKKINIIRCLYFFLEWFFLNCRFIKFFFYFYKVGLFLFLYKLNDDRRHCIKHEIIFVARSNWVQSVFKNAVTILFKAHRDSGLT